MHKPMVSVIIPVYNGADYLACAIDSALAQSWPNTEVIVINDGSADEGASRAVAQGYEGRIRYYEKQNGGVATALNLGIEKMQGEYFAWLSHDDYYLPKKIENQMELLQTAGADTIIYGDYRLEDMTNGVRSTVEMARIYTQRQLATPLFAVTKGLVNGCTVLIHKSHFERVGLFEPELKTTQDYNMWLRMFRGARVAHCPHADVVMRQHPAQGSRSIALHEEEGSRLWVWIGEEMKDYEKAQVAGTPYLFYEAVYDMLRQNTTYTEAIEYYAGRMRQEKQKRAAKKTDDEQKLIDVLIQNYDEARELLDTKTKRSLAGGPAGGPLQTLARSIKTDGLRATLHKCGVFLRGRFGG